jgi:hypothetical protein
MPATITQGKPTKTMHNVRRICKLRAAAIMRFNVTMTGPPTLAAKPPSAVVGPCRLICYANGLPGINGDKDTGAMLPSEAKGASFFVMSAPLDCRRIARR